MKTSNILYVAAYEKLYDGFENPTRKVGITGGGKSTTNGRMSRLSNGTEAYSQIIAVQSWLLPNNLSAKNEESYLHNLFDAFNLRTNREWFNGGNDDINKIEEIVEMHMLNLINKGFKIVALHEEIDEKDENHEIISNDDERIKIRGKNRSLPKLVTINGEHIEYKAFIHIYRKVFKFLVDKNKITKDMCPICIKDTNENYIINTIPEHKNEKPFRSPYEYKGLVLESHGSANAMVNMSYYLVNRFGNNEIILNIVD